MQNEPPDEPTERRKLNMDKLSKRYGNNAPPSLPGGSGNGKNTRNNQSGQNAAVSNRGPGSQQATTSSATQSGNIRGSQLRGFGRNHHNAARGGFEEKNDHKFGWVTGRNWGSVNGGVQPQGLGSFSELGLNAAEQGSRKHNYSHLLNLSYGHRGDQPQQMSRFGGHQSFQKRYAYSQPKYNKEQFLQANCQFIVKDTGDYVAHHVDPDIIVEWGNIELIKVYSHEVLSCPICLHPPVAAKMTRCGHVYCWPCVLHYLALSDSKWRKCPICYESVYASDLKSMVTELVEPVKLGSEITMRLMVCEKGVAWPFPVDEWTDREGKFYNIKDKQSLDYSKILLIRGDQLQREVFAREECELLFLLETEGDNPEACFTIAALKELGTRLLPSTPRFSSAPEQSSTPLAAHEPQKRLVPLASVVYASAFDDLECDEPWQPIETVDCVSTSGGGSSFDSVTGDTVDSAAAFIQEKGESFSESVRYSAEIGRPVGSQNPGGKFYFYQSSDGQHVYLHPLNVRMLVAQYGSLSASPVEIAGRILDCDTWSITEDVRKRYRYLSHLPLTCVCSIVELDLKPPYVSLDTVHDFDREAHQREHIRQLKLQDEANRQWDAENAFRKDIRGRISSSMQSEIFSRLSNSPPQDLNFSSEESFPVVGSETPQMVSVPSTPSTSSATMSFAQMLREGKVQSSVAREPLSKIVEVPKSKAKGSDGEGDEVDGHHQTPVDFQSLFSAGLDAAFDQLKTDEKNGAEANAAATAKGGKKKRTKSTVLFATGMVPRV